MARGVRPPHRIALLAALALTPCSAGAAEFFEEVGVKTGLWRELAPDSRSEGMALAYTAVAEGATALWWNPGALALPRGGVEASYSHRNWIAGLDQDGLSAAAEHRGFGLGMHASRMSSGPIERTTVFRPDGDGTFFESNLDLLLVGGGVDVVRLLGGSGETVALGIGASAVEYKTTFTGNTTQTDEAFTMESGALFSWNVITPVQPSPGDLAPAVEFRAGHAVENLLDNDRVERWDRGGLALAVSGWHNDRLGSLVRGQVSLERRGVFLTPGEHEPRQDRVGGNLSLAGMLEVRGGWSWDSSLEDTKRSYWGIGFGLRPGNPLLPRAGLTVGYAASTIDSFGDVDIYTVSGSFAF